MTEQGNSGQRPLTSQSQAFTNTNQLTMASGANISGTGDGMDGLAPIFPPTNFDVPDISFSNSVIPNADFNTSLFNNSSHMFASSGAQYGDTPSPSVGAGQLQKNYFPPTSNSPPGTSSSDDSDDLPLAQLAKRGLTASTGNLTSGGSPSGLGTDATSQENSPISNNKKTKSAKRKKKKDPNEPQKPVSAYALFFRDTQATIKGHNPNASFGDVSKIVASMWDQLDPEHKDVYKKKTETAKKQYLKQLAAYRASQVSQSAMDESESSSSPPSTTMTPAGATLMSPMLLSGAVSQPAAHIPVTVSGQMIQQPQQQMMQHMVQQQQMHQMQQHFPPHQMVIGQQGSPSPPLQQQQQHSPLQQQGSPPAQVYSSPPHSGGDQVGVNSYQHPVMGNTMYGGYTDPPTEMDMNYPHCVRSGCGNYAKENPSWDSEYCSNDCVISHCRDIFTKWVASRTDSNSFPVK